MFLPPPSSPDAASRARPLWWACGAVFACMPPAMGFAHRSAPLFVTVAALLALIACLREGSLPALLEQGRRVLATPLGIAALAFLAYALLSTAWSPAPRTSLFAYGELLIPLVASFVLALALPSRAPRWLWIVLALLAIGATLVLLIDLSLGLPVRRFMRWRMNTFVYNRPALTLLVLAPPLLTALIMQKQKWLALSVGLLITAAIFQSESGAAKLGTVVGGVAYAVARWRRTAALTIAAAAIVAAFVVSPITGQVLDRFMPEGNYGGFVGMSSRARVDIWRSFGAAVHEQPFLGSGFAPGTRFPQSSGALRLDPGYRFFLTVGHPHNGALQIWTELGAVGVFLGLTVLFLILRALAGLPPATFASGMAFVAAATAASLVGHGLWQGWWTAALGGAVTCALMLRRLERENAA
jgi:exopolysaccharide production protein ExoQ